MFNSTLLILNNVDGKLQQTLDSAITTGDSHELIERFAQHKFNRELLDSVLAKIAEDFAFLISDLTGRELLISNTLQVVQEFIQAYGIGDTVSLILARTVLSSIIEENFSITIFKRAINVFNLLLTTSSTIKAIISDESLEGSLQILGRKISLIGDYESQALLFEALYRITNDGDNRKFWSSIWFKDITIRNLFLNLDPSKFESNCRKALNYINRSEPERRVFSFVLYSVSIGNLELKEPFGCEFWVDFNYDSSSISFYCSDFHSDESMKDSELWETIVIADSSVKSYSVKEKHDEKLKELLLVLNYPCHTLITSSFISPDLNGHEIMLSFPEVYDVIPHLEKIYGRHKSETFIFLEESRKISGLVEAINIAYKESNENRRNKTYETRKISQSDMLKISQDMSEDFVPKTEGGVRVRKISQSSEIVTYSSEAPITSSEIDYMVRKITEDYNKKVNDSESFAKNQGKIKRLYNVEKAPLYDVPPSCSQNSKDRSGSSKNNSRLSMDSIKNSVNKSMFPEEIESKDICKSTGSVKTNISPPDDDVIVLFESDDDFKSCSKRTSSKRKYNKDKNTKGKRTSQKRKIEASTLQNWETPPKRQSSRPSRKAAIKSTKKTKQIFDSSSSVVCNSEKLGKSPQSNKDDIYGFPWVKETSKRDYSGKRKSQYGKRKLPVEIVSNSKSETSKISSSKGRENADITETINSNSKFKNEMWAEFEKFDLVIEKTRTRSYSITKNLENEFQHLLTGSQSERLEASAGPETVGEYSNKKNNGFVGSTINTRGIQIDPYELHVEEEDDELEDLYVVNPEDFHINKTASSKLLSVDENNISEDLNDTNPKDLLTDKFAFGKSDKNSKNSRIDKSAKKKFDKNLKDSYIDETASRKSDMIPKNSFIDKTASGKAGANPKKTYIAKTASNKSDTDSENLLGEIIFCKSDDVPQNIITKKKATKKSQNAIELIKSDETEGNKSHLKSCIKGDSAAEYKELLHKTKDHVYQTSDWLRNKSTTPTKVSPTSYACEAMDYEFETKGKKIILEKFFKSVAAHSGSSCKTSLEPSTVTDGGNITSIHLSDNSVYNVTESVSLDEETEKETEYADIEETNPIQDQHVGTSKIKIGEKRKSQSYGTCDSAYREGRKKRKANPEQLNCEIKDDKNEQSQKSKNLNENCSLHSKIVSSSLKDDQCDTKWFYEITFELMQGTDTLNQKLLATVQKCVYDYYSKIVVLRGEIAKAVEASKLPSHFEANPNELKDLIASCKSFRKEVENSLKQMQIAGKKYFEAEETCYKKLRDKHVKANRKYILSMKKLEQKAKWKLGRKVLLKTRRFLRNFVRQIDSA